MVIFPIMRSGRKQQSTQKKNHKFFMGCFALRFYLFPVIKRGKKKEVLFFSVTTEGKCDLNHEKKGFFFSPLGSYFYHFGR